jgi:gamma-glutamylcysteine synthetase
MAIYELTDAEAKVIDNMRKPFAERVVESKARVEAIRATIEAAKTPAEKLEDARIAILTPEQLKIEQLTKQKAAIEAQLADLKSVKE